MARCSDAREIRHSLAVQESKAESQKNLSGQTAVGSVDKDRIGDGNLVAQIARHGAIGEALAGPGKALISDLVTSGV